MRLNESYQEKSSKVSNSDTLRILQTEWCTTRWLRNSSLFQSLWRKEIVFVYFSDEIATDKKNWDFALKKRSKPIKKVKDNYLKLLTLCSSDIKRKLLVHLSKMTLKNAGSRFKKIYWKIFLCVGAVIFRYLEENDRCFAWK